MKKLLLLVLLLLSFKAFAFLGLILDAAGESNYKEFKEKLSNFTTSLQSTNLRVSGGTIEMVEEATQYVDYSLSYMHLYVNEYKTIILESNPDADGVMDIKILRGENHSYTHDSLDQFFNDTIADFINEGKDLKLLSISKKKIIAYYVPLE